MVGRSLKGSLEGSLSVPYLGVLIIRILLFRVLYQGPLFSESVGAALGIKYPGLDVRLAAPEASKLHLGGRGGAGGSVWGG